MDLLIIAALLVVGACSGFAAGLFGIGGGILMVPLMTMLFAHLNFPAEHIVKVAIATSLTTIAFTSLSSIRAHQRHGAVRWDAVRGLAPGILFGSLLGANIAGALPSRLLAGLFGAFIGTSALRMLRSAPIQASLQMPRMRQLFFAGAGIGGLSALLGAGGGFLTVPYLLRRKIPIHTAVASSAACGFPIAVAGTLGYAWSGRHVALPAGCLGYIYLPALICVATASIVTAPWGAHAAHALPTRTLKQSFAALLFALAAYMLISALRD